MTSPPDALPEGRPAPDIPVAGSAAPEASAQRGASDRAAAAAAFWGARPRRLLNWQEAGDGQCVVLRPKLGGSRAGRWFAARLGDPFYRIRLDDVGTFIWNACDGEAPLTVILGRLRDAFGARVEPADERLGRFVQTMRRSRMIEM